MPVCPGSGLPPTHIGHRNILQLCDHPFASVEEMDEGLINRWSGVVSTHDVVWMLGDYAMGDRSRGLSYLSRLAGKKRLVTGNHDDCWVGHRKGWQQLAAYHAAGFEVITPWARARIANQDVMLSHLPTYTTHGRRVSGTTPRWHGGFLPRALCSVSVGITATDGAH